MISEQSNTHKIRNVVITAYMLIVALAVLNRVMTYLDVNEHMYITAGYLIKKNNRLYEDFAYLQMPLLPLLYGYLYKLFDTSHYLMIGKLVSYAAFIASCFVIHRISIEASEDKYFAIAVLFIFSLNSTIIRVTAESSNYITPIFCSLMAYILFLRAVTKPGNRVILAGMAGLCVSIATGIKLYYAAIALPFAAVSMLYPRSASIRERVARTFIPLIVGMAIGILPVTYYLLRDPELFIFDNIGFHVLKLKCDDLLDQAKVVSPFYKFVYARDVFFRFDNLIPVLGTTFSFMSALLDLRSRTTKEFLSRIPPALVLSLLLLIVTAITTLKMTPLYIQYFAMPISFSILLFISSYHLAERLDENIRKSLLASLVIMLVIYSEYTLFYGARAEWKSIQVHDVAQRIRDKIGNRNARVATLSPLYVIEADLEIYRELATGQFLYQIGDLLTPEQRKKFCATSPKTIHELFKADPPTAILVGFEGPLDSSLKQYAISAGYQKADGNFGGGELYIRR